jgi:hypothetical protein
MASAIQQLLMGTAAAVGGGGGSDPNWTSVKLLMGFNGPNGSTTVSDESSFHHSLLTSGNILISNAQFVFGPTSLNGASPSLNILFNDSVDFSFGTGAFTIEFWLYPTVVATMALVLKDNGANNFDLNLTSGTSLTFRINSSTVLSGGSISQNTWQAICVERDASNVCRLYVNGVMVTSATSAASIGTGGNLFVASRNSGATPLQGYMDELRITKGVARYASNAGYTVATSAFPRS